MAKTYKVPDGPVQKIDTNTIIGFNLFAMIALFVCNLIFPLERIGGFLLVLITAAGSALAIRSLLQQLPVPEKPDDPFEDISDSKRLDLIYVLQNVDIFEPAVDPRYLDFVHKYLKDEAPENALAIPEIVSKLDLDDEPEEMIISYRERAYVVYMSAIAIGTIALSTGIMGLMGGLNALFNLLLGLVCLGGGLVYSAVIKKRPISVFYILFGSVVVFSIIGGLLMRW